MRSNTVQVADRIKRVQTGVRMERRMVKVLKAVAELRDLALGELLESLASVTGRGTTGDGPARARPEAAPARRTIRSSKARRPCNY